jgi:DNA mismatch repair protein MutS
MLDQTSQTTSNTPSKQSPLMRQYFAIKQQYPQTLILFQVGDFYELFWEDAQLVSALLGLALTKKGFQDGVPIPLCGVPRHSLDHYLTRLTKLGHRVAICDQLTQPTGKLIERGVTQVLTPGTLTDTKLLDDKSALYCAYLVYDHAQIALAHVELLTGQVLIITVPAHDIQTIEAELARFCPRELVIQQELPTLLHDLVTTCNLPLTSSIAPEHPSFFSWFTTITNNYKAGIEHQPLMHKLLKLIHSYTLYVQPQAIDVLSTITCYSPNHYVELESTTITHLELIKNLYDNTSANTLLSVLDHAPTSMGSRVIKKWLLRPLQSIKTIQERHDAVHFLYEHTTLREQITHTLKIIGDTERVLGRIALSRANLSDYLHLKRILPIIPQLKNKLPHELDNQLLSVLRDTLFDISDIQKMLENSLNDDLATSWLIKQGYHHDLDRYRQLVENGTRTIAQLEETEQKNTGINSLKIRATGPNGYAIEITKTHLHLVPVHYTRIQSLSNKERFTTQELKDLEYDLQRAQVRAIELEKELFDTIKQQILATITPLRKMISSIATIDALVGLTVAAHQHHWTKPQITTSDQPLEIRNGRHPVIENTMPAHQFIPNDITLDTTQRLLIITGPNMGGKSTFMRQTALIVIMAQIGSFIPADHASIPIIKKIFTRIGAADHLAQGKSTFLVEMEEAARICQQATPDSLVILDEIGRGTSTHDGMALAQAILEFLHTSRQPRCLFATHYHELANLTIQLPATAAYHAAIAQTATGLVLLHKIIPGIAEGSFGFEVARMAGLPPEIITRAQQIAETLS